jgi:DNA-binding CsgD family transcriptional regulator
VQAFAFYLIPETGEVSMSVVRAQNFDTAKVRAVAIIKRQNLREIRLWDGHRVIGVKRPPPPRPKAPTKDVDERSRQMLAMKAQGKPLREIAAAFGISIDRVRQLMARAQLRDKMRAEQPNGVALSTRAYYVLKNIIHEPEDDPAERDRHFPERVAALTRVQVFDAPNSGNKTIDEIEAWLWERGLSFSTGA